MILELDVASRVAQAIKVSLVAAVSALRVTGRLRKQDISVLHDALRKLQHTTYLSKAQIHCCIQHVSLHER